MNNKHKIDDIQIGMSDLLVQTVTKNDLVMLSELDAANSHHSMAVGESSNVEVLEHFPNSGLLSADFINNVLTAKLPGPNSIYLGNRMSFKTLVKVGEEITTKVVVSKVDRKNSTIILDTTCTSNKKVIAKGRLLTLVKTSPSKAKI